MSLPVGLGTVPTVATNLRAGTRTPVALPLTVHEDAGIARRAEVVSAGVPFARENGIRDPASLSLRDAQGEPVPVQWEVLARWDAPRDDAAAAVRWATARFPANVRAKGRAMYQLSLSSSSSSSSDSARPPLAGESGGAVRVDAGSFDATFRAGEPGPLVLTARAPDGSEARASRADEIVIEENGPLFARVRVRGSLDRGFSRIHGDHRPLRWTAWWSFTRGAAGADVQFVVENPDRPFTSPYNDKGKPRGKRFERLSLEWAAEGDAGAIGRTTRAVRKGGAPRREIRVGGLPKTVRTGEGRADLRVVQASSSAFVARAGKRVLGRGRRAEGWIAAPRGEGVALLGMRRFWQNHPKGLVATADGTIAVDLFPIPTTLGGGRAKTHLLALRVLPDGASAPSTAAAMHAPLRATVPPEWLQETRALGLLAVEDGDRWPAFEGTLDRIVGVDGATAKGRTLEDERRHHDLYGWMDFGDTLRASPAPARRFGNNEFDFGWVLLRQYLREPDHDPAWRDAAEDALRHAMDVDVLHTDDDAAWANRGMRKHDVGDTEGHSHAPDFSHFWLRGIAAWHLVGGDPRAREVAVDELGRWIAARETEPGRLVWGDELRDVGWALIALVDLYELTGDEAHLARARRIVERTVEPHLKEDGSMGGAAFLQRKGSFAPWQQAYIADGLARLAMAGRRRDEPERSAEKSLERMLGFLCGDGAWVRQPTEIHGRRYPEMLAYAVTADGKRLAEQASMSQALADPAAMGWLLTGNAGWKRCAERSLRWTFPDGPDDYFHPSRATSAKNAAIRLYFGEAARFVEQTGAKPLAGTAGLPDSPRAPR